jgi:hypothetical protein
VRRFWRRRGEDLESRLERRREPARPEYVNQLARELRSTGRRRFAPVRLLLAAALTLLMLVAVASVGGVASGALVRDHVVGAVKSVNKKVTAKRGSSWRYADDDDDDRGGGGGDDDDDDNGGGGDDDDDNGGGDDDDDDDPDDDQYDDDDECEDLQQQVQQAHRTFHRTGGFTGKEHRLYHQELQNARDDCDEGGGDDDDDD